LRVLYLGDSNGTSLHRANALRRLGHDVQLVDSQSLLPRTGLSSRIISKLIYEIGAELFTPYVQHRLFRILTGQTFDLIWVNGGELLGASTVRRLRQVATQVLNYNNDDPFGRRDKNRFALYRQAVPEYDLVVVLREENVTEAQLAHARDVLRVSFSADETDHAALSITDHDRTAWARDVLFIGTWMPERGPFLAHLLDLGVPITIWGNRWERAKEWPVLKDAWAGPGLLGKDYVKSIQCSKICLGLLSKGNRDLHTQRSVEIPYIGGLLCAERTSEHLAMYEEDQQAVFWSTPQECAAKCFWLLDNPDERIRIAKAGHTRCIANGTLNEVVVNQILDRLKK
jgi:spore maturation protein CgeB